jgi:hypothetical protein
LDELGEEWPSQGLRDGALTKVMTREEEKLFEESQDKRLDVFMISIGLMWRGGRCDGLFDGL